MEREKGGRGKGWGKENRDERVGANSKVKQKGKWRGEKELKVETAEVSGETAEVSG